MISVLNIWGNNEYFGETVVDLISKNSIIGDVGTLVNIGKRLNIWGTVDDIILKNSIFGERDLNNENFGNAY